MQNDRLEEILEGLTEEQKSVVMHNEGAMFVRTSTQGIGGVLAKRIAYLLEASKGQRFKILFFVPMHLLTTRLHDLVEELVGNESKRVRITTFHEFCMDVLKKYGSYIDLNRNFKFFDDPKNYVHLMREAINDKHPSLISPEQESAFYRAILYAKNNSILQHNSTGEEFGEAFWKVNALYQKALEKYKMYDESDLLKYTNQLFRGKTYITNDYRKAYRYFMVLDGGMMNRAQFDFVKVFCSDDNYNNVLISADDSQFAERFDPNVIRFEELVSFMKQKEAVEAELRLTSFNYTEEADLIELFSKTEDGEVCLKNVSFEEWQSQQPPLLTIYKNHDEEIEKVGAQVQAHLGRNESLCVMVAESSARMFNRYFQNKMIPCYYLGFGKLFFHSKKVQTLTAILYALHNEEDSSRIRKIGEYFGVRVPEIELISRVRGRESSLFELLIKKIDKKNIRELLESLRQKRNEFGEFAELFWELARMLPEEMMSGEKGIVSELDRLEGIVVAFNLEHRQNRTLGDFLEYLKNLHEEYQVVLLTEYFVPAREEYDYVFLTSFKQPNTALELEKSLKQLSLALRLAKKRVYISYAKTD